MAHEQVLQTIRRWIEAELRADIAALDNLLANDFSGIGPRGFVLTREQWVARYRGGDLRNEAFTWHEVAVRVYGDTALAVGIQDQRSSFQHHDASGQFRATLILVRQDQQWRIVGWQASGPLRAMPPRQN